MSELLKEPDGGVVPDFHVKLQSDTEQPTGDPGKSLTQEVAALREEHKKLTGQIAQLCSAVRALVQMQSVLERAVKSISENPRPDFGVL